MAKTYEVVFSRGVLVTVPDDADEGRIRQAAVEIANSAELEDMYFTDEDVNSVFVTEENRPDEDIDCKYLF
jgi:hypothetical protein